MFNWVGDVLCTYNFIDIRKRNSRRIIVNITEATERSGLADRLKTMRTAYVCAAESGFDFYIYHTSGFRLEDYFEPNEINWKITAKEMSHGLNKISFNFLYDKFRLLNDNGREWHFHKALASINDGFLPAELKHKYNDAEVYRKLFKFSDKLITMVNEAMDAKNLRENEYNVVHTRFTNFFEIVEIYGQITSTEEERKTMLKRLSLTLRKIHQETSKPIVLFSDSNTFLQYSHPEYIITLPGDVSHISNSNSKKKYIDKTFIDFVVMSKAARIYSIIGDNIYGGGFAKDASYLGNKPYFQVPLEPSVNNQ